MDRPLARQMPCPVPSCRHEHHLLPCERCDCTDPPIPGITLEDR